MSDTAAPKSGCARKLLVLGLLLLLGAGGAGFLAYGKAIQETPLDFPAFKFKMLEEPALMAKFEFMGNLKSWLTGEDTAQVSLSEREFNGLMFGNANHDEGLKARVLIEGDALRVESSERLEGEPARYLNIQSTVKINMGPESTDVEILDGLVGELPIKGPIKGWLSKRLGTRFQTQREENPRLKRLKALWVEDGKVQLVYTPPE